LKLSISRIAAAAGVVALTVASFLFLGGASVKARANATQAPTNQAAAYCTQEGGVVELRTPWYGTNGPKPLHLSGGEEFCAFTASDGSRIYVNLQTLYTTHPSLAALAYYAEEQPGSCEGNPASCYCTLLGGSDQFGGTTGAGGGWVKKETPDVVLEACIFPDMSTIDSWGLFYHSAGIIRGINLDGVLRYPDPYDSKKK
jgi:putative hemolysin